MSKIKTNCTIKRHTKKQTVSARLHLRMFHNRIISPINFNPFNEHIYDTEQAISFNQVNKCN